MTAFNPALHNRRSIRLKGYDYAQEGFYFITICCQDRAHLFGEMVNGEMNLNEFGEIAFEEWKNTEQVRDNCKIYEFVIMPNHIHGIIEITINKGSKDAIGKFQSPSQTVGSIVRGFKIVVIKKIKDRFKDSWCELKFAPTIIPTVAKKIKELDFKIWQRDYFEIIIRNEQSYERISNYIRNNPKKWKEDKFYICKK
jgi:REP element-mobilizing transposase RayT